MLTDEGHAHPGIPLGWLPKGANAHHSNASRWTSSTPKEPSNNSPCGWDNSIPIRNDPKGKLQYH